MQRLDESSAECHVFTYREGLLSAVAHDLRIQVMRFSIEIDEAARTIRATADARSLRVDCALRDGAELPGALSDANLNEIQTNIAGSILEVARYPEVRFESSRIEDRPDGFDVEGILDLHGRSRSVRVAIHRSGERDVAELKVEQPDFGIKPYSAMLGALRVRADVLVRVSAPRAR